MNTFPSVFPSKHVRLVLHFEKKKYEMKDDILSFAGFGYIFPERFEGKVLLSYREPAEKVMKTPNGTNELSL